MAVIKECEKRLIEGGVGLCRLRVNAGIGPVRKLDVVQAVDMEIVKSILVGYLIAVGVFAVVAADSEGSLLRAVPKADGKQIGEFCVRFHEYFKGDPVFGDAGELVPENEVVPGIGRHGFLGGSFDFLFA